MKSKTTAVVLLVLLALLLTACGSSAYGAASDQGTPEGMNVTRLKIVLHTVTDTQSTVTIDNAGQVQRLYDAIRALPKVKEDRICTMLAGPQYDLTFLKGEQSVLTAHADAGGCGTVSLAQGDQRQPDKDFWTLLQELAGDK